MVAPMGVVASYSLDAIGMAAMLLAAVLSRKGSFRFDAVSALLFARIVWLVIVNTICGNDISAYLNISFFASVAAFVVYSAATEMHMRWALGNRFLWMTALIVVIMLVQMLLCYVELGTFSNFSVNKYFVSIPYGESNSIAMGFIAMCIFLYLNEGKKYLKVAIILLSFLGLIMLSSSGCMLSIAILLLLMSLAKISRSLKGKKASQIVIIAFLLIALFVLLAFVTGLVSIAMSSFSGVLGKINEFLSGNIAAATTGRVQIYSHYKSLFFESPIVGYGTAPIESTYGVLETYRAHNWILEALNQGGLVNLALYASACVLAMKNINNDAFSKSAFFVASFLLINSLFEPGIFGFNKDFLMWLLLGLAQTREGGHVVKK